MYFETPISKNQNHPVYGTETYRTHPVYRNPCWLRYIQIVFFFSI